MSELNRVIPVSVFLAFVLVLMLVVASCGKSGNKSFFNQSLGFSNTVRQTARVETLTQAIDNTNAFNAPSNVDFSVFDQLKEAFISALEARGKDKFTSAPPSGEENKVTNLVLSENGEGQYKLTWTYKNLGDYDLNGEVGIPDITPIAQNYLASASDGAGNDDMEDWIDGSRDGEVGIPDITPIAQNYLANVAGYNIYGTNSLEDAWTAVDTEFDISGLAGGVFPPVLTFELTAKDYDMYKVVPRDSTGEEGADSNVARFQGPITITGFSKNNAMPGEIVEVYGTGFDDLTVGLESQWNGTAIPLLNAKEGQADFIVPPFETGPYSFALSASGTISNTLDFTIDPIGALPYTSVEFASHIGESMDSILFILGDTLSELDTLDIEGFDETILPDVVVAIEKIGLVATEVERQMAELSDEDVAMMQALYINSGLLDALDVFGEMDRSTSRTPSVYPLSGHFWLSRLDILSMMLSNVSVVMDLINLVSFVATAFSSGAAAPVLCLSFTVSVVITLVDYVIDTFIPTDLKGITVTEPEFIFPDFPDIEGDSYTYELLPWGTSIPFQMQGRFTNDSVFGANTFTAAINIFLAKLLPTISPNEVKQVADAARNFAHNMFVMLAIDPATYIWGSAGTSVGDFYVVTPPIEVYLDMSMYRWSLEDTLRFAFPGVGDILAWLSILERLGINPSLSDSVIFSPDDICTYDYLNSAIVPTKAGSLDMTVWGWRYEDKYFLRKFGWWTYVTNVTIDPPVPPRKLIITPDKPSYINATDAAFSDHVRVSWSKVEGATGYRIYRSNASEPKAEVGEVYIWDDFDCGDSVNPPNYEEHLYWVSAFFTVDGITVEGEQGIPDTGSAIPANLYPGDYVVSTVDDIAAFSEYTGTTGSFAVKLTDDTQTLAGLENLKIVKGGLIIGETNGLGEMPYNAELTSLDGLSGLTEVYPNDIMENPMAGIVSITGNPKLNDMTALLSLQKCSYLYIRNNPILDSLDGFGMLQYCNSVTLLDCPMIPNLQGLSETMQGTFPGFEDVFGVKVGGCASLESLNGLPPMVRTGTLSLFDNPSLTDLTELSELEEILGDIDIYQNDKLATLAGLDNVKSVSERIDLESNPLLTDISALKKIESPLTTLEIWGCEQLQDLNGLQGITVVNGDVNIVSNDSLTSLTGLDNLGDIDGELDIALNPVLSSLSGLGVVTVDSISLESNPSLSTLAGLGACEYCGTLSLYGNTALHDIGALSALTFCNSISIDEHPNLKSFGSAFNSLSTTGGINIEDCGLTNLNGFDSLTKCGPIDIAWCYELTQITGFGSLEECDGLSFDILSVLTNLSGLSSLTKINGVLRLDGCDELTTLDDLSSINQIMALQILRNDHIEDIDALHGLQAWSEYEGYVIPGSLTITNNIRLTNDKAKAMLNSIGGESAVQGEVKIEENG